VVTPALLFALSYLLGSLTFGPLLARWRGVDLRATGSGNIGATNVARALGKKEAILTLLGDGLKGAAAVGLARSVLADPVQVGICGLCAIIGHNFPVWLSFRGGKGVATSLGVLAVYVPYGGLTFVVVWLTVFRIWRVSSLAAMAAFAGTLCVTVVKYRPALPVVALLVGLAVVMHRSNIRRLFDGTEARFDGGDKTEELHETEGS